MTHPLLERHLERQSLRPLYLFFGEEEFLMERALKRLEQALSDKWGEAVTRVVREAPEVSLEEFFAQARLSTLWGSGQLLILRRAETYPAQALDAVVAYLDHPAPRSLVVLTAPSLKSREAERHPVVGRLSKDGAAVGFFSLREGDLLAWLAQDLRGWYLLNQGLQVDQRGACGAGQPEPLGVQAPQACQSVSPRQVAPDPGRQSGTEAVSQGWMKFVQAPVLWVVPPPLSIIRPVLQV